MLAFLRLVTNPRVFERPEPIGDAWQQVRAWLASESAWVPQPTERHASLLGEFLALPGVHGNLVPDAHLPALAWSTGKRSAPRMGTLPDFWDCDGLIRSHHESIIRSTAHLTNITLLRGQLSWKAPIETRYAGQGLP